MEEWVATKLLDLGYDPEKGNQGSPTDVYALFRGHLDGLLLFDGEATLRCQQSNFIGVLRNEYLYLRSFPDQGTKWLYISALGSEGGSLRLEKIQPNDIPFIKEDRFLSCDRHFSMEIKDVRERPVGTVEFWVREGMLYVPKKRTE